uniref:Reverse transcriptase domain-containing protein n=1 Tax=Astyanax mexicanus TaxID=7994 RepID=A0A8B9GNW5_ASTMX
MEFYGFSKKFINILKLLYKKTVVQINVNGVLTDKFEIKRGVKQGCPLSAALYIMAISPLLNRIKSDKNILGVKYLNDYVKISAYADDIAVFIKNQEEWQIIQEHFKFYEEVSGAKLNTNKTEGIWMGEKDHPQIEIELKEEVKILGLIIKRNNCNDFNWDKKSQEIKNELGRWKIANYKTRINIIKSFILPKLNFLATIFPPKESLIISLNKLCVRFIWGNNREVTKRDLLFKNKALGGLGALDLGLKLKVTYCKMVAQALKREAVWIGEKNAGTGNLVKGFQTKSADS